MLPFVALEFFLFFTLSIDLIWSGFGFGFGLVSRPSRLFCFVFVLYCWCVCVVCVCLCLKINFSTLAYISTHSFEYLCRTAGERIGKRKIVKSLSGIWSGAGFIANQLNEYCHLRRHHLHHHGRRRCCCCSVVVKLAI